MTGDQKRRRPGVLLPSLVACALIICYAALILPFSRYMGEKPFLEKLGEVPKAEFLQIVSADQKQVVGEALVLDVLMYFGGVVAKEKAKVVVPPDYKSMSRLLHASVQLDPYNMDPYYFGQSILAWDVNQIKIADALLDYGMKYRTWDWYLPFFTGFNHAYFLKDYRTAAKYYMRAGELSGNSLFINLAGRYLNESGQNDLALAYLSTMIKGAKNQAVRETLATRLKALKAANQINRARDAYRAKSGHLPGSIETLVQLGYLRELPKDPYGGTFFLDPDGTVKTTSNFASPAKNK